MPFIDRDRWQRLEPLLDRALELPADARGPWLALLRAESPAIAEELMSLLAADAIADREQFLATPLIGRSVRDATYGADPPPRVEEQAVERVTERDAVPPPDLLPGRASASSDDNALGT
jgi:hypothetical protein